MTDFTGIKKSRLVGIMEYWKLVFIIPCLRRQGIFHYFNIPFTAISIFS